MDKKILFRLLLVISVISVFLFLFLYFWKICAPILISYIFFYILKPFVRFLERRGFSHFYAVISVFFSFLFCIILVLIMFIPSLLSEFSRIRANLPEYSRASSSFLDSFLSILSGNSVFLFFLQNTGDVFTFMNTHLRNFFYASLQQVPVFLTTIVLFIIIVPFTTFFLLLDEQKISKSFIRLVPNRYFEIIVDLLYSLEFQFGLILRGLFLGVFIISVVTSLGLWIIRLEYPLVIGIIAGVTNLIPYAGPVIGLLFAFLTALISGSPLPMYGYIILVILFVQLLDNVIVQPLVMSRSANLHPLLIIFLVLLGSSLGGVLGMLVIVPLAGLSHVILSAVYRYLNRPSRPDFSLYHDIESLCR